MKMLHSLFVLLAVAVACAEPPSKRPQEPATRERTPPQPPPARTAPAPVASEPVAVASAREATCIAAECGFDPAAHACKPGARVQAAETTGPECACAWDGSGCVVSGWRGDVPCRNDDACSCTNRYSPAPRGLFPAAGAATPERGSRPGDCIARCRKGTCWATQAPL